MSDDKRALTITTIIESLMDYSRQLIVDERTDGQDYGSAAVVDGITFMKDLQAQPPAPPATCASCVYWDKWSDEYSDTRGKGQCRLPEENNSPVKILGSYYEGDAELVTPADWHCAGWQARP